jgi:DNA-binding HxlR family transcriptional regulator
LLSSAALEARVALLLALFHHRWSLPALVEIHRGQGSKFITLVHRLGIGRDSARQALDALIAAGMVMRNPGHGHPMRPEYILTPAGERIASPAARLLEELAARGLLGLGLRKWPMAVVFALAEGAGRFSELKAVLPGVTSRALTLALKDLQAAGIVARELVPGYPPTTAYALTAAGRPLAGLVASLAAAAAAGRPGEAREGSAG